MIQTIIEAKLKLKYNKISFVFFSVNGLSERFYKAKNSNAWRNDFNILNRNAEPQF